MICVSECCARWSPAAVGRPVGGGRRCVLNGQIPRGTFDRRCVMASGGGGCLSRRAAVLGLRWVCSNQGLVQQVTRKMMRMASSIGMPSG